MCVFVCLRMREILGGLLLNYLAKIRLPKSVANYLGHVFVPLMVCLELRTTLENERGLEPEVPDLAWKSHTPFSKISAISLKM